MQKFASFREASEACEQWSFGLGKADIRTREGKIRVEQAKCIADKESRQVIGYTYPWMEEYKLPKSTKILENLFALDRREVKYRFKY